MYAKADSDWDLIQVFFISVDKKHHNL
jgi:hypothetical protein